MDSMTILELCDRLQELLMENGMEDVPVIVATSLGNYASLSENDLILGTDPGGDGSPIVLMRP